MAKRSRTIEEVEWFRDVAVVTNFGMGKRVRQGRCGLGLLPGSTGPARLAAPEFEVALVHDCGHGFSPAVAGHAGKLASREPGSIVPDAGLQSRIQLGKLPLEAGLTVVGH